MSEMNEKKINETLFDEVRSLQMEAMEREEKNEKLEAGLLKIEELVYRNQQIPASLREEIQRIIVCEAGVTPPPKNK